MASNNNASGGSKQNNIGVHTSFFKKEHYYFNPVPDSLRASVAAPLGIPSTDDNIDLWIRAYGLVQKREAKLMKSYTKHLSTLQADSGSAREGDLLDPIYVKSTVNQLINIRENNKINVMLPRADTEIQEQIEKLVKSVIWSDVIVKAALETQPHVALAWSGVSIFLPLLADVSVYNKAMLEGFNTLIDMQVFWKACEETHLISSDSQPYYHLRDPLAELYSFIIEYQARAICHIAKPLVSRTLEYVCGSDNWTEMIQPIQNLEQNCLRHITEGQKAEIYLNSKSQFQAIQKQVTVQEEILQNLENNKQDDMERKLLGDLAQASGDYTRYKNINPERVPGTCEWFLKDDRFCKWRDSQTGELLWTSAGPGCGKSVLSRSLIDEGHLIPDSMITIESSVITTSQRPFVICYFFFKEGGEGQMDGAHALCALLHQLFQHRLTSNLITCALPSHKSHRETLTQKMEVLWQILVDCAKSSPADIICVLDALDECRGESAQQLLHMVEKSYSQHDVQLRPSKLRFLITSRPYDDLKWSFDRLTSIATYLHFDGDEKSRQIGEEINLVIDVKVKQIAGAFSENDCNKISDHLKNMENRTYLWLHLTLNIIEKKRAAYSRITDIEELLRELPSNVADAYEKILSRSQDDRKAEALLQIVLAATRPLTLDEANNALALAVEDGGFSACAMLKEKLWPQNAFKTTVQNLCGLFISIHESKLSFIHLTAREFLVSRKQQGTWKGRLNLSKSHGILSGACINYLQLLDRWCESPRDEYPFFSYAFENWHLHFCSQDAASIERLRKPARELCRTSSALAHFWFRRFWKNYEWQDLQLATNFGLAAVVYDIIVHEHPDINAEGGEHMGTALGFAIKNGDLEVMKVLLDLGAKMKRGNIERAAGHHSNAEAVMTLLLDKRGSVIKITQNVLGIAVANRACGAAVLALLLKRRGGEIRITDWLVEEAAGSGSVETMSLLLDERGNKFKITEGVVRAAIRDTKDMLALLLKRRGHEVKITEAFLMEALPMEALETSYLETLDLLLDHCSGIKITEQMVVQMAAVSCAKNMQLLLDKRGHEINITEDIVKAAMSNAEYWLEIITLLLDKRGDEIRITEDIVKAAVSNAHHGSEITALLLDKRGNKIKITEDIVKAAVSNTDVGLFTIAILLDERGDEIRITEDIVKAAVSNADYGLSIMALLLDKRGDEIRITEDISKAAVGNRGYYGREMVSLLLDRRGDEINITEDIFKAAVGNRGYYGREMVSLLLDRRGDEINITEDIFKAAAGNPHNGPDIVSLLLDRREDEINVTKDMIMVARKNPNYERHEMLAQLQKRRGKVKKGNDRIEEIQDNSQKNHYKKRLKKAVWFFWRRPG